MASPSLVRWTRTQGAEMSIDDILAGTDTARPTEGQPAGGQETGVRTFTDEQFLAAARHPSGETIGASLDSHVSGTVRGLADLARRALANVETAPQADAPNAILTIMDMREAAEKRMSDEEIDAIVDRWLLASYELSILAKAPKAD